MTVGKVSNIVSGDVHEAVRDGLAGVLCARGEVVAEELRITALTQ